MRDLPPSTIMTQCLVIVFNLLAANVATDRSDRSFRSTISTITPVFEYFDHLVELQEEILELAPSWLPFGASRNKFFKNGGMPLQGNDIRALCIFAFRVGATIPAPKRTVAVRSNVRQKNDYVHDVSAG